MSQLSGIGSGYAMNSTDNEKKEIADAIQIVATQLIVLNWIGGLGYGNKF